MINVCYKVKFTVKDDPNVTDGVTEGKMRTGFSNQALVNTGKSPSYPTKSNEF